MRRFRDGGLRKNLRLRDHERDSQDRGRRKDQSYHGAHDVGQPSVAVRQRRFETGLKRFKGSRQQPKLTSHGPTA